MSLAASRRRFISARILASQSSMSRSVRAMRSARSLSFSAGRVVRILVQRNKHIKGCAVAYLIVKACHLEVGPRLFSLSFAFRIGT